MKRIPLPHEPDLQGLQFSAADTRALMTMLIGVTVGHLTDADRTFAKLLILRYSYFLSELEREGVVRPRGGPAPTPRPDQRQPPFTGRRKKKGGRR